MKAKGRLLTTKKKWKPVQLEGAILNNLEGLIGIEELHDTDYTFDKLKKASKSTTKEKVTKPKKKKKKQKLEKVDENLEERTDFSLIRNPNPESTNENEDNTNTFKAWSSYGLHETILNGIRDLKFEAPTKIQELTLAPAILGRKDILGAAETGSGKTLAYGLPILNGIVELMSKTLDSDSESNVSFDWDEDIQMDQLDNNEEANGLGLVKVIDRMEETASKAVQPLYALILTPTRELAMQVKDHLVAVSKYTGIKVAVLVGGMAAVKQERILRGHPEIVVSTPGRLWELIQGGNEHLAQVDRIRFLVIDETDRMLEAGHFQELHQLLERINTNENTAKKRQNFVFSATLTMVHDLPKYVNLKQKKQRKKVKTSNMTADAKLKIVIDTLGMSNTKIVDITSKSGTAEKLTECRITCSIDEKDYYLFYFLKQHPGRTLIFCNSIGCVKRLATLFALLDCDPLPLHASMHQKQRLKNLEKFRDNENAVLVATDVAARGLDIPQVQHVIHYQVPRTAESYVHRSGRTARASVEGITILFMEPAELKNYVRLCRTLQRDEDLPLFPVSQQALASVKQRVDLARDIDKLELHKRKTNSANGWISKAIEDMDLLLDDRDIPANLHEDNAEIAKLKRELNVKRKRLSVLLATPVIPRGISAKYPSSSVEFGSVKETKKAIEVIRDAVDNYAKSKGCGQRFARVRLSGSIKKRKK